MSRFSRKTKLYGIDSSSIPYNASYTMHDCVISYCTQQDFIIIMIKIYRNVHSDLSYNLIRDIVNCVFKDGALCLVNA